MDESSQVSSSGCTGAKSLGAQYLLGKLYPMGESAEQDDDTTYQ